MINGIPTKKNTLWHLVNALQGVAGGGVCKRVTLVAYFDAQGNCIGREEIVVTKLYPKNILRVLFEGMIERD